MNEHILVAPAGNDGCGYVRMILPYSELSNRGYDVEFIDKPQDITLKSAHYLVLQRQTQESVYTQAEFFKKRGGKIVFEFDDNFHTLSPANHKAAKVYGTGKPATLMFEKFLRLADVAIVSVPTLATEYAKFNQNIHVCYNAIDDAQYQRFPQVAPERKRPGQIRIGWAGTGTHGADMAMIVKPLCRVLELHDEARLVFVGADMRPLFPHAYRHRIEFAGHSFEQRLPFKNGDEFRTDLSSIRYFDLIQSADFDIGIAPIERTTFNKCKSYIKLMEYGMLGIPAVASRFGPYSQYAQESESVLTADTDRDWQSHLLSLIESPEKRVALSAMNREYVGRECLISTRVQAWQKAFETLKPSLVA